MSNYNGDNYNRSIIETTVYNIPAMLKTVVSIIRGYPRITPYYLYFRNKYNTTIYNKKIYIVSRLS